MSVRSAVQQNLMNFFLMEDGEFSFLFGDEEVGDEITLLFPDVEVVFVADDDEEDVVVSFCVKIVPSKNAAGRTMKG